MPMLFFRLTSFIPALLSLVIAANSWAAVNTEQQTLFLSLEKSLKSGDTALYNKRRSELKNYALLPYLDYLKISKTFAEQSNKTINHFINTHASLPQSYTLRSQWLRYLASNKRWHEYLNGYSKTNNSQLQCLNGVALLETGQKNKAWKAAKELWLVGKSQNKACDPLFAAWKKAGKLSERLTYDRFWLAIANGDIKLARYLDNGIKTPAFKAPIDQFWFIYDDPEQLTTAVSSRKRPYQRHIVQQGVIRLMYQDMPAAVAAWSTLRKKFSFTAAEQKRIDERMGLRIAKSFSADAELLLDMLDPNFQHNVLTEWRIRLALSKEDWTTVRKLIAKLPRKLQQNDRWRYWKEVAQLKQAQPTSSPNASTKLKSLAQERSFYGFLAASLSDNPLALNHKAKEVAPKTLNTLAKQTNVTRAKEWLKLQRPLNAQSEINRATQTISAEQKQALPYLMQQWGWNYQAILQAAQIKEWDDLNLRFPNPEPDTFITQATKRDIDPLWAVAIARQESAFRTRAYSSAGAMGLMQLMPATAKDQARRSKIPLKKKTDLYKPEVNIALGVAHLSWLSEQFDGNRVLSTAAYNAGGTPIKRWQKERGHLPLDIWIETIPYDETRNYVQNVLTYRMIYAERSGYKTTLFSPEEFSKLALRQTTPTTLAQNLAEKPTAKQS